jgi:hypothetical protein
LLILDFLGSSSKHIKRGVGPSGLIIQQSRAPSCSATSLFGLQINSCLVRSMFSARCMNRANWLGTQRNSYYLYVSSARPNILRRRSLHSVRHNANSKLGLPSLVTQNLISGLSHEGVRAMSTKSRKKLSGRLRKELSPAMQGIQEER